MSHYDVRSLRELAQCHEWLDGDSSAEPLVPDFSVVHDLLGYRMGLPETLRGGVQTISLLREMRLQAGVAFDVNVIAVSAEDFTDEDWRTIDASIAFCRDVLAPHDLGLRKVTHFAIAAGDAPGRAHITSLDEAEELTHEWSAPSVGLDVFVTRSVDVPTVDAVADGQTIVSAPLNGPADPDRNGPMTGVVIGIQATRTDFARALAWGICRYLGAQESADNDNLMFGPVSPAGGTALTASQADDMRSHDLAFWQCNAHYSIRWSGGF
jgi:hypothetical protein